MGWNGMKKRCIIALLLGSLTINGMIYAQDSDRGHQPVTLTLLHLNDTHSNFLSSLLKMSFPQDSEERLHC